MTPFRSAAVAVLAFAAIALSGSQARSAPPDVDAVFPMLAAQGNNAEVDMARLALRRSDVLEVRGFAQKMIAEHGEMARRLAAIAPASMHPMPRIGVNDALALKRLAELPLVDFDQEYLMGQIGAHLTTISLFETEQRDGRSAALKAFVTHELPDVRAHLELAVGDTRHVGGSSPFYVH